MTSEMADSQRATLLHIQLVAECIGSCIRELSKRQASHDASKLVSPEAEIYAEWTPKLSASIYGSPEYHGMLAQMRPALKHHYANNRHHPEFWVGGIKEMNLCDLLEMICDWCAAASRHTTGDPRKSVEINQQRFGYSDDLRQILLNTVVFLQGSLTVPAFPKPEIPNAAS